MNGAFFWSYVFGIGIGIGATSLIAASLLEKRNVSGDSHGDPAFYCRGVQITDSMDNLGISPEVRLAYLNEHTPPKAQYPADASGKDTVEKKDRTCFR